MKRVPFKHIYDNPVARRIFFIYGDVFNWEHINQATMEQAVPGFFGNGNITFFEHISLMIRASQARDARGRDRYLENLDAFKFPINFLTGEHNRMFVPKGLQRSYDMLRRAHGPVELHAARHLRLRSPGSVAGHQRRARRVADRPR